MLMRVETDYNESFPLNHSFASELSLGAAVQLNSLILWAGIAIAKVIRHKRGKSADLRLGNQCRRGFVKVNNTLKPQ